jgi:protein SCO1/2
MTRFAWLILAALWPATALADLTEAQLGQIALEPAQGARVPTSLIFKNLDGNDQTFGNAMAGLPTLLLPADFTCTQICGPALSIAANALSQTKLRAGIDYSLIVVGIDSHDGIDDARRFTTGQVGGPGVSILSGDEPAIQSLMASIGYHFQRDATHDAVAHPAALVTLTSDGHVSRVLSSLALRPTDLQLALVEAGGGKIGGLAGRLALLCYGFDAAHGIYTRQIATVLRIGGAITVVAMAMSVGVMLWLARKRGASV